MHTSSGERPLRRFSGVGLWYCFLPNVIAFVNYGDDWQRHMKHLCAPPQDRNVSWQMWAIQIGIAEISQDANFVVTSGTAGCHSDYLRWRLWGQSSHHNNPRFATNMYHHTYIIMAPMVSFMATIVHRTDCWLRVLWVLLDLLLLLYIYAMFLSYC